MNHRIWPFAIAAALFAPTALAVVYNGFSDTSSLTLNGSAAVQSTTDGSVLRLTPATTSQSGSAFSSLTLNAARFSTFFKFRITEPGGNIFDCNTEAGADGLVFVVQSIASDIGGGGQGIGYAGIDNSVGVEFDTWCNASNNDPNSNHLGIDTNGSVVHGGESDVVTMFPDFDDGNLWYAWVDYDGSVLEVRTNQTGSRPATATLSKTIDIPSILGNVTDAYAGFTSGTGSDWGNHDVVYWEYREEYDPVAGDSPCCASFDPATGIASIPCLKVKGISDEALSVTMQYNGGSSLTLLEIGEGISDCCGGSSGDGGAICSSCACADYAAAHPDECGRTGSLNFRSTWHDLNDVDIHVVYTGADGTEEIYFGNTNGSITGGELDVDGNAGCSSNVSESPVENIVYDDPPSGTYEFKVCGWANCIGGGSSNVTVQALSNGTIFWEGTQTLTQWNNECVTVYTYTR